MPRDLTDILGEINRGQRVHDELFDQVYSELKKMAKMQMRFERNDQTLQSTALVHEAYIRLSRGEKFAWKNRRHFFAAAAESMRRILIEAARSRGRVKRGGNEKFVSAGSDPIHFAMHVELENALDIDQCLSELEAESPDLAELVKLRFFAGLSMEEIARCLETSLSTVERRWRFARAWLMERLK